MEVNSSKVPSFLINLFQVYKKNEKFCLDFHLHMKVTSNLESRKATTTKETGYDSVSGEVQFYTVAE